MKTFENFISDLFKKKTVVQNHTPEYYFACEIVKFLQKLTKVYMESKTIDFTPPPILSYTLFIDKFRLLQINESYISSPYDKDTEDNFDIYMYKSMYKKNSEFVNFFTDIFLKNCIRGGYLYNDRNFVIAKTAIPDILKELTVENFEFFTDTQKYNL